MIWIEEIATFLSYDFMIKALVAALLVGVACAVAGTYMVTRRLVFLGGGITHSSFGGVGMAYHYGLNPVLGAAVFAIISALAVEKISESHSVREDSAIGILWSVGMAVGIIFIVLTPGYAPNLMSFLFGNILLINALDLWMLIGLDVVLVVGMTIFYRSILYTALDKEFAAVRGIPVRAVSYLMMMAIALTIVFAIKVVGIMLLMSLLTIPPVVANMWSGRYGPILWLSGVISVLGLVVGIVLSYVWDVPAGATTVILLGGLFVVARGARWISSLV